MIHIQENRKLYNIPTGRSQVEITRYLNLLKKPGQMPPPLAIEAFANLNKVQVWVYYDGNTLLKYGPEESKNICKILCLAGVHYNLLCELPVAKATTNESQISDTPAIQMNAVEFQEFTLLNESFEETHEDAQIQLSISPEVKTEGEENTDTTLVLTCIRGIVENYLEGSIHLDGFFLSSDDIRSLQQACPQLRKVIRAVTRNLLFTAPEVEQFKFAKNRLFMEDDVLYYQTHTEIILYVVPFEFFVKVAVLTHVEFLHAGKRKLRTLLLKFVWHPQNLLICKQITKTCVRCQAFKTFDRLYHPPILQIKTTYPFQMVAVDLLQLPKTRKGYNYLLVTIDHYSKWLAAVPIKTKSSANVSHAFLYSILPFLPFLPTKLLSDNGREFVAPEFEQLLEIYHIAHIYTTPYSPSSNGAVERVNRTLIQYLRVALKDSHAWDESLPKVIISYNHSEHSALQCSPCEFLLQQSHVLEPTLIIELTYWLEPHEKFESFKVGDLVGIKKMLPGTLTSNKFQPRYVGPYVVEKIQSNNLSFIIFSDLIGKRVKAHLNQLRRWFIPPDFLKKCKLFRDNCASEVVESDPVVRVPVSSPRSLDGICEPSSQHPEVTSDEDEDDRCIVESVPALDVQLALMEQTIGAFHQSLDKQIIMLNSQKNELSNLGEFASFISEITPYKVSTSLDITTKSQINNFPLFSQYTPDFSGFRHSDITPLFTSTTKSEDFSGFISNIDDSTNPDCNNRDPNHFEGFQHPPSTVTSLLTFSSVDTSFFHNLSSPSTSITSYFEQLISPISNSDKENINPTQSVKDSLCYLNDLDDSLIRMEAEVAELEEDRSSQRKYNVDLWNGFLGFLETIEEVEENPIDEAPLHFSQENLSNLVSSPLYDIWDEDDLGLNDLFPEVINKTKKKRTIFIRDPYQTRSKGKHGLVSPLE